MPSRCCVLSFRGAQNTSCSNTQDTGAEEYEPGPPAQMVKETCDGFQTMPACVHMPCIQHQALFPAVLQHQALKLYFNTNLIQQHASVLRFKIKLCVPTCGQLKPSCASTPYFLSTSCLCFTLCIKFAPLAPSCMPHQSSCTLHAAVRVHKQQQ